MNLESSGNILDVILSSLENLTPEQEEQKKLLEEKSRMLKQISEQNLQYEGEAQNTPNKSPKKQRRVGKSASRSKLPHFMASTKNSGKSLESLLILLIPESKKQLPKMEEKPSPIKKKVARKQPKENV